MQTELSKFNVTLLLSLLLFVGTGIGSLSFAFSTVWAQSPPAPAPEMARYWMEIPVTFSPASPDLASASVPGTTEDLADAGWLDSWTNLTFQSGQDGNWEIYFARSNGSERRRLTNHPAADTQPRLDRGAQRVVFVSDRDGNSEIYSVNIDGTNLLRLTTHSALDTMPIWSPDGQQIAFVSTREGNADIYRMNADGTSPMRLIGTADDDVYPTWSPDGRQIAWVRANADYGQIWIANADGNDAHAIGSTMYHLGHLAWSPDGTQFAFEHDNRPSIMGIDGSYAQDQASTEVGVAQTRSWAPDGRGITYSIFYYRFVQVGDKTETVLDRVENFHTGADTGESTPQYLQLYPLDALPDWQTADALPPVVSVSTLPALSKTGGVYVAWDCQDRGNSGCVSVDVETKTEASQSWQSWHTNTSRSGDYYLSVPGETVAFRARGRDVARNESSWTADTEHTTRFYAWDISGQVTDSRGNPLVNGDLDINPLPLAPVKTDRAGKFVANLAAESAHTLAVVAPGYETVSHQFDAIVDTELPYYLRSGANLILNGDFEEGSTNHWTSSSFALLSQFPKYLGANSLALGFQCAPNCLPFPPELPANLNIQDMMVDSAGMSHAVVLGTENQVLYVYRQWGGQWSAPELVSAPQGTALKMHPQITSDAAHQLQILWSVVDSNSNQTFYFSQRLAPDQWFTRVLAVPAAKIVRARAQGYGFHIVYAGDTVPSLYGGLEYGLYYLQPGAVDPQPQIIASGGNYYTSGFDTWDDPVITVARDGTVHVVWWHQRLNGSEGKDIFHVFATPGHPFSSIQRAVNLSYERSPDLNSLYVDELGRLHVVWYEYSMYLHELVRAANGVWGQPTSVSNAESATVKELEQAANRPLSTYDDRSVSQVVTIPASMRFPTLAFAYRIDGVTSGSSYFEVSVTHAITGEQRSSAQASATNPAPLSGYQTLTTTSVFRAITVTPWKIGWADLAPWQGQTLSITFVLHEALGDGGLQLYLDNISLTDWKTPVIHQFSREQFDYGQGGPLMLIGDNIDDQVVITMGSMILSPVVRIDDHSIEVTVPSDLPAGAYELAISNAAGLTTLAPHKLIIGRQLYLPLLAK